MMLSSNRFNVAARLRLQEAPAFAAFTKVYTRAIALCDYLGDFYNDSIVRPGRAFGHWLDGGFHRRNLLPIELLFLEILVFAMFLGSWLFECDPHKRTAYIEQFTDARNYSPNTLDTIFDVYSDEAYAEMIFKSSLVGWSSSLLLSLYIYIEGPQWASSVMFFVHGLFRPNPYIPMWLFLLMSVTSHVGCSSHIQKYVTNKLPIYMMPGFYHFVSVINCFIMCFYLGSLYFNPPSISYRNFCDTLIGVLVEEYFRKRYTWYATVVALLESAFTLYPFDRIIHIFWRFLPFPVAVLAHFSFNTQTAKVIPLADFVERKSVESKKVKKKTKNMRLRKKVSSKSYQDFYPAFFTTNSVKLYGVTYLGDELFAFPSQCSVRTLVNFLTELESDNESYHKLTHFGVLEHKWKTRYLQVYPPVGFRRTAHPLGKYIQEEHHDLMNHVATFLQLPKLL